MQALNPFPGRNSKGANREAAINSIAENVLDCELDLCISDDSGDIVSAPWGKRVPLASGGKTWSSPAMSLLEAAINSTAADVADCEIDLPVSNDPEDIVSAPWNNRVPATREDMVKFGICVFSAFSSCLSALVLPETSSPEP